MHIRKIGEFGLIEKIKNSVRTDNSVIKGIGDDCAVLSWDKKKYQLFTCDMLVEGVDFLSGENPYLIGRKAIAVALSDIAACAGIPRHCLVSLAMPADISVQFVQRFLKGILSVAEKFGVNIVGGDISRAPCLAVDVSVSGFVEKKFLVLRKGAKKGDVIFVSGSLGGSLPGRHLRFTPRLKEARFLVKNFKVNAMLDISDGLAQDLGHILKENNLGAVLYEELIPLHKKASGLKDALYSGEDFELLFTLSPHWARKLLGRKLPVFKPIGEMLDKKYGLRLIDRKGSERLIKPRGFRHF